MRHSVRIGKKPTHSGSAIDAIELPVRIGDVSGVTVTVAGLCKQDSVETGRAIQMEKATTSHSRVHRAGPDSRAHWD